MKQYRTIPIYVIALLFCTTAVKAQQGELSSGGGSKSTQGSISYSVGQAVVQSQTSPNGSLTSGLQQTYEVNIVTALPETKSLQLQCVLFPNPTKNQLLIQLGEFKPDNMTYVLTDYSGKKMASGNIQSPTQELDMQHLPAGVYFLTLTQNMQALKSFKITKH